MIQFVPINRIDLPSIDLRESGRVWFIEVCTFQGTVLEFRSFNTLKESLICIAGMLKESADYEVVQE